MTENKITLAKIKKKKSLTALTKENALVLIAVDTGG